MRVLSLFSGGGLGDYGLELAGMEIVGQVEIDEYCQKILSLRWPNVPKWKDIRDVTGKEIREVCGTVDLVSGGFPCQPFSTAGKRRGEEDDRNLWPEMCRVIREVGPQWVIAENVSGIIGIMLDSVLSDLENEGYKTIPLVFSAHALGAPHKRERLWIIANRNGSGCNRQDILQQGRSCVGGGDETISNGSGKGLERNAGKKLQEGVRRFTGSGWWEVEPNVGRVVHGVANRVDRLKLLGNGQVVQVVEWIGKRIMEFDKQ